MNTIEKTISQSKSVQTNAGKVAVFETGVGDPIVMLHPNGHDHQDFDLIVPLLAKKYRVITLDWPGHGESEWLGDPAEISVVRLAEVLEEIVESMELKNAVYLGNSIGGFCAARLAVRKPNLVRGLVLINSGGFNSQDLKAKIFCRLMGINAVASGLWNLLPRLYLVKKNAHVLKILQRIREHKSPSAVKIFAAMWKSFLSPQHDLTQDAVKIIAPTLVVWGARDPVIPLSVGKLAAGLIPNATLRSMPTGHQPFAEDAAGFMARLMPFLDSLQ